MTLKLTPQKAAELLKELQYAKVQMGGQLSIRDEYFKQALERNCILERICAEAYQAVGALADVAGVFETSQQVSNLLDNLSQCKIVHSDVLPFTIHEDLNQ